MNESTHNSQLGTLDLASVCKATRFAVACIVFALSYYAIRSSLDIPRFQHIYGDMLGENETLPVMTTFVFWARHAFLALSIAIPVACVTFLFNRNMARSIYWISFLVLLSTIECIILHQASWAPIARIIEKMQTPS